jgi:arylsulfatase A-like enzyme
MVITHFRWYLLVVLFGLIGCSRNSNEPTEDPVTLQPLKNFVLICIDTVRADVFYNLGAAQDDSLTAWQDMALVFEQAQSTAPWTIPSLGSVFSGLWAQQHGAGQFPQIERKMFKSIPASLFEGVPVLAESLNEEGFETTVISSSGWTMDSKNSLGVTAAFKETIGFETPIDEAVSPSMIAKWREVFTRQAMRSRAFSFLHLMEAHNWHSWPGVDVGVRLEELSEQQRALYLKVAPPRTCEDEQSEMCRRFLVYASAVAEIRAAIAKTLETLSQEGLLGDTLVVVFSDHGEEFGDHFDDGRAPNPHKPLQGFGHGETLYQELLHVPLLVWHPQFKGQAITDVVSLTDIAPSAARWLDVDFMPEAWDGRFLDDRITRQSTSVERVVYASGISHGSERYSARRGDEKAIWNLGTDHTTYFDLATDPFELNPQPTDSQVLLFDGLFLDYAKYTPKKEIKPGVLTDNQIRRLQSIGYLQGLEVIEQESEN